MKISKVKDRNLYYCNVRKPDGKYKKVYGKTKKEVREKAEQLKYEIQSGHFVDTNNILFKDWANEWLENYLIDVSNATKISYRSAMINRIIPRFGNKKLQKINHHEIQLFINSLGEEDITPKFIKNIHLVLHRCLRDAQINGFISKNPSDKILLPKIPKKEMAVMDTKEITEFLELAYQDDPEYADCYEFLILTGLRISEFIGLTKDSFNPETRILKIDKQFDRNLKTFALPKQDKTREIILCDRAIEIIENRLDGLKKWEKFPNFNPLNLIFLNPSLKVISDGTFRKRFKKLVTKMGRPELRVHDLRHTYTTLCLFAGLDVKYISESLGHESVGFTLNKYGHSTMEMNIYAAQRLNTLFENFTQN